MKMMVKPDRRKGPDRRKTRRFHSQLEVAWEGSAGSGAGTISEISPAGCFVLSSGDVEDGDQVRIDIPLTAGGTVSLWGEVINHVYDIGFGIRFVALTDSQRTYLERFTETLETD
jgi:hypothetical protein